MPTTALADEVFFDERRVAVVGSGGEVQVEGPAPTQVQAEGGNRVKPAMQEVFGEVGIPARGLLGPCGALGDGIESGKQGQPFV